MRFRISIRRFVRPSVLHELDAILTKRHRKICHHVKKDDSETSIGRLVFDMFFSIQTNSFKQNATQGFNATFNEMENLLWISSKLIAKSGKDDVDNDDDDEWNGRD